MKNKRMFTYYWMSAYSSFLNPSFFILLKYDTVYIVRQNHDRTQPVASSFYDKSSFRDQSQKERHGNEPFHLG